MNKYLIRILTEMCDRVGADYNTIDFQKSNWYYDYEWTIEEEDSFIRWLIDHLVSNPKITKELYGISPNKKWCEKAAASFRLSFCWKIKQD